MAICFFKMSASNRGPFHFTGQRLFLLRRLLPVALLFAEAATCLGAGLSSAQSDVLYQQMLRDPQFKAADKELSAVYSSVRKQMDPAGQARIRDEQREWLKSTYESISKVTPSSQAALGTRLTRERIQVLRQSSQQTAAGSPQHSLLPQSTSGPLKMPAEEVVNVDANLAKLKSKDPDRRLEALRSLEYSVDPRLPAILLGLLDDVGNTTRRVAAHGIGSRWWQIPKEQVELYIARLKRASPKEQESVGSNECHRSIALLQQAIGKRIEHPEAVSISPNGRWIIYDRRGLPCLVDTQTQSEELLGWGGGDYEGRLVGTLWHPSKEIAAMSLSTRRGTASLIVWSHGSGTQMIHKDRILDLLQKKKIKANPLMSFISEDQMKWRGDKLIIPMDFATETGDDLSHVATAVWNLSTGEVSLEGIK